VVLVYFPAMLVEDWVGQRSVGASQVVAPAVDDVREPAWRGSNRAAAEPLLEMIGELRAQAHEYANRIHTVSGLLALGMQTEAQEILDECIGVHAEGDIALVTMIEVPALAGLVVAKRSAARSLGVCLRVGEQTALCELPPRLSELDAVSVVGNLLDNAIEATASVADPVVELAIFQADFSLRIEVRDNGPGLESEILADRPIGRSSKGAGRGYGLAVVRSILASAGGEFRASVDGDGGTVAVTVPF
jgi:two-component system, CitB family, sensor kinase